MSRDAKRDAIVEAARTWQVEWTDAQGRKRTFGKQSTLDGQGRRTLDEYGSSP